MSPPDHAIPWLPIIAAVSIGPLCNLFRVTSLYACYELQAHSISTAGVIGIILNPIYIVFTAVYTYFFFGDAMTPIEIGGASTIGGAVLGITGVKWWRGSWAEAATMDEEAAGG